MQAAVLVVDDDDDIREVLRALLEDEGYYVDEARNGAEALQILRTSPRRYVVLLDLRMPVLDGVAVVSTVAQEKALLKRHAYILATADNRTMPLSFVQQLTRMEIPVLSKPFEERKLFTLISAASNRLTGR